MTCRYCNVALTTSRSFVDGEFCCDSHRRAFEAENESGKPLNERVSAALQVLRRKFPPLARQPQAASGPNANRTAAESSLQSEPIESEGYTEEQQDLSEQARETDPATLLEPPSRWRRLTRVWETTPRDLKVVSILLTAFLISVLTGVFPTLPIQDGAVRQLEPQGLNHVQDQIQQVVAGQWRSLNETISDRAAVVYADDFRSGLDAWESHSNLTRSWSYDAAGFVRPGPLAVFKPTVDLSDYRFAFLGEIDEKAMGWAFRAQDLNNYYAMKFVIEKPGPLPVVHMVRYAVINGKEGPHVDKVLPMTVRKDMLYHIEVDARGGDFTIMAQGQEVDFWSDHRLRHGGVGFFCNHGERARLRWVEVSHQYDALGRLCAYLAPYSIEGRNGSIN